MIHKKKKKKKDESAAVMISAVFVTCEHVDSAKVL